MRRFIREVAIPYDGDDCLKWPFANAAGYGHLVIDGTTIRVNRIICTAVHGPAPTPEHEAAHSCGMGHLGCCAPHHLRWATSTENHADKIVHGTTNRGERHGMHKLTTEDVIAIRSLLGTTTQSNIAARFDLNQSTISSIKTGKLWGWLH